MSPLNPLNADPTLGASRVEPETPAPGAMLAHRRAARGLALADVANRLKFAPRQIEALEADDYGKLPGMTFVRGMIRSYAKLLEMDAGPMIQALERRHVSPPVTVEMHSESIPFPDGRVRSTRIYLALSALIVLAVGGVVYEWRFGMPEFLTGPAAPSSPVAEVPASSPVAAAPPSSPVTAAPGSVAPAQASSQVVAPPKIPGAETVVAEKPAPPAAPASAVAARIQLKFDGISWVEVRDRSGKVLTTQINPAGSSRTVAGEPPFSLVIGNASHVRLTYKDEPIDLKPHTKVDVARLTLK